MYEILTFQNIFIYCRTSNNLLHHILVSKNKFRKIHLVEMDRRDCPLSSGTKIKLIALVVVEINASIYLDYEKVHVFYEQKSLGCEVLMVRTLCVYHTSGEHIPKWRSDWFLFWMDKRAFNRPNFKPSQLCNNSRNFQAKNKKHMQKWKLHVAKMCVTSNLWKFYVANCACSTIIVHINRAPNLYRACLC